MKYVLEYAQPRPAKYNPTVVVVWERKSEVFEVGNMEVAEVVARSLLGEGSVICGGIRHCRSRISLKERPCAGPVLQPKPEFLLVDE